MTNHDAQKAYYFNSWKTFFFNTLGWSGQRVSEWMRKTSKDRLLEDDESWLYHDPPVIWAVEALLSYILPEQLSSKAMTVVRNEILDGFAVEEYQVSLNTDWLLHRKRINQALKKYGTQLPQATASPLIREAFPENAMRRGAGSSFTPDFNGSGNMKPDKFMSKKLSSEGAIMFTSNRTTPNRLIVHEFAGV